MRAVLFSFAFAGIAILGCGDDNAEASPGAGLDAPIVISVNAAEAPSYQTLAQGQAGVKNGYATRYWDACKASCSWGGKAQALGSDTRCKSCSRAGLTEIAASDANKSACDGGNSYACFDQIPIKVNDNLAYAFAATPGSGSDCGKCYQLQFDGGKNDGKPYSPHEALRGKTLIVMSSNIGHDVSGGQFDVMIPGGGVGQYDAFSSQIGVSKSKLGNQYGGLLRDCVSASELGENWNNENRPVSEYQDCLRNKCSVLPHENLKDGCMFLADWMMAANNPTALYKEVDCPEYLKGKYKATMF